MVVVMVVLLWKVTLNVAKIPREINIKQCLFPLVYVYLIMCKPFVCI